MSPLQKLRCPGTKAGPCRWNDPEHSWRESGGRNSRAGHPNRIMNIGNRIESRLSQTLNSSMMLSSSDSRLDVPHWLMCFRTALRLGLCPEQSLIKIVRSSKSAASATDLNNTSYVLLSGPATIKPVRSLPIGLDCCQ